MKIRVSDAFKAAVSARAGAHDQSVSDYVRQVVLESLQRPSGLELVEIRPSAAVVKMAVQKLAHVNTPTLPLRRPARSR